MSQPKSNNTKWLELLQESIANKEIRPPGSGWVTFKEILKIWKFGENKTGKVLFALKKTGKVDVFNGIVFNSANRKVKAVWYRIKAHP